MKLNVIASGSSGNCACLEYAGHYIFVDVGVPFTRVKAGLDTDSVKAAKSVTLFITHEHHDHISGLVPFINKLHPKIYSSGGTADYIVSKGVPEESIFILGADNHYDMDDYSVMPFKLTHDAVEPLGYKFDIGGKRVSFATDFGVASDYIYKSLEGTETLLLESNYEDELLSKSSYPRALKNRIASSRGHLSNKEAFKLVGDMSLSGLKRCFLAHVSENSNDYDLLDTYAKNCKEYYDVDTNVIRQKSFLRVLI